MKISIITFFMFLTGFAFAQNNIVTLPGSTLIVVRTINELTGKQLKTGQEITCTVALDVVIESDTLIKAGSPVFCLIENSESSGMVGQGGDLVVSLQNAVAIDGTNVPLTGSFRTKGESSVGEKVAIGAILCPLVLLGKGEEAIIPVGSQTRAFTIGEYKIKIRKDV